VLLVSVHVLCSVYRVVCSHELLLQWPVACSELHVVY